MGVLSRLNTLIKSNLNAAVDRMSNPAREIDILVAEMEDALKAARLEVQANLASEKLAIKQRDRLLQESREWEDRAARAVKAGDDNLARKALEQKAQYEAQAEAADKSLREQEAYVDQLSASLKELEARVKEVKLRGRRYVVCLNERQARKDAHDRELIVESLLEKLKSGDKSLIGNGGYRKFLKTKGKRNFQIDEEKILQEARLQFL